jgi:hypothetical protein
MDLGSNQKYMMVGTIRMSMQAYVILILGLVMTLPLIMLSLYFLMKGKFRAAVALFLGSLLWFGVFIYIAYVVNCSIVGQCYVLSWILVAFYIAFVVVQLVSFIAALSFLKKGSVIKS